MAAVIHALETCLSCFLKEKSRWRERVRVSQGGQGCVLACLCFVPYLLVRVYMVTMMEDVLVLRARPPCIRVYVYQYFPYMYMYLYLYLSIHGDDDDGGSACASCQASLYVHGDDDGWACASCQASLCIQLCLYVCIVKSHRYCAYIDVIYIG